MSFKLLGVGSPLVDYSLAVPEKFIDTHVPGGKGGTRNISAAQKDELIAALNDRQIIRTPGGSAANTIRAFSRLGGSGTHFGKIGRDDDGDFFRQALLQTGSDVSLLPVSETIATGFCLSLITPDAERTMLSNLGASLDVRKSDLADINFNSFGWLLLEGYLICEPWIDDLLEYARNAGCKIAVDLNNFELVKRELKRFRKITDSGIDLLFANLQEASALFPDTPEQMLPEKLKQFPMRSVLKLGQHGSMIIDPDKIYRIDAVKNLDIRDTTGAGDFYAAGFFYGLSKDLPPEICGRLGAICAAEVIRITGTMCRDEDFEKLYNIINNEV